METRVLSRPPESKMVVETTHNDGIIIAPARSSWDVAFSRPAASTSCALRLIFLDPPYFRRHIDVLVGL